MHRRQSLSRSILQSLRREEHWLSLFAAGADAAAGAAMPHSLHL